MALLLSTMYHGGGYMLIDRHDNPFCPHCSEIVLGKVQCSRPASGRGTINRLR
jgi:hypothetical protein